MPIYNNVLAGSGQAGAAPDLGEPIEQSLRFSGDQRLVASTSATTGNFTMSFWWKRGLATVTNTHTIFLFQPNQAYQFNQSTDEKFAARISTFDFLSDGVMRDHSAWYHIVLVNNSGTTTMYLNGVKQADTATTPSGSSNMTIGSNSTSSQDDRLVGHLAEFNMLDGTVIGHTTDANGRDIIDEFGRYNEDNVWVPKEISFTSDQYGAKGFRLTFDSSQNADPAVGIGIDSAPTGSGHTSANNFTATNFETTDVVKYSKDVFTSPTPFNVNSTDKNFSGTNDGTKAFDGSTGLWPIGASANEDFCIFRPSTPLSNVTSLTVEGASDFDDILVNGTSTGQSTSGSTLNSPLSVTLPSSPLTLTSFAVKGDSDTASQNYFARISVGTGGNAAVALVDNTENDVDYLDTPTSNYSTLNPLFEDTVNTPTEANLATTSSGSFSETTSTIGLGTTESWYAEIIFDGAPTNPPNNQYGFTIIPSGGYDNTNIFSATNAYIAGWTRSSTTFSLSKTNSDIVSGTLSSTPGENSVLQLAYNASTRELYAGIDNTNWLKSDGTFNSTFNAAQPTQTLDAPTGGQYMLGATVFTTTARINYGQRPFIFTPPTGFKALQTNNLAAQTIKDGKDYFEAITYTGTGVDSHAITGLNFKPDLVWIKPRSVSDNHRLIDSVRGVTTHLVSNSTDAEPTTNAQILESFDAGDGSDGSAGFTLNGTDSGWNGNTSTYVAWCWKAGGTAVSNTDGTITSSVSANTKAGFSIVSYTGTGSNATVGHGLTEAPEWVVTTNRTDGGGWSVWHTGIAANQVVNLNNTSAAFTATHFNSTAPSSSIVNLGSHNNTNESGKNHIMYCWHSVDGFSKFGSYTGNGAPSSEGPFVYTGFKVSWLMIRSTSTGDWRIYDTSRTPNNENKNALRPNLTNTETSDSNGVDLLSNGFKIRWGNAELSSSGVDYMYMAFAENPFGGENVPPATAH